MTLRLLWPQWQGAGTSSVTELAAAFPFGTARCGYAVGSAGLAAVLPPNEGPVATAPVAIPGGSTHWFRFGPGGGEMISMTSSFRLLPQAVHFAASLSA